MHFCSLQQERPDLSPTMVGDEVRKFCFPGALDCRKSHSLPQICLFNQGWHKMAARTSYPTVAGLPKGCQRMANAKFWARKAKRKFRGYNWKNMIQSGFYWSICPTQGKIKKFVAASCHCRGITYFIIPIKTPWRKWNFPDNRGHGPCISPPGATHLQFYLLHVGVIRMVILMLTMRRFEIQYKRNIWHSKQPN